MAHQAYGHCRRTTGPFLVKVQTCDREGRLLHEGDIMIDCADRQAAIDAINLRLKQFDEAGYDREQGYWWGRSRRGPCQQTRFVMK